MVIVAGPCKLKLKAVSKGACIVDELGLNPLDGRLWQHQPAVLRVKSVQFAHL